MTESELIKEALAEFARAADVYEQAKQKVAALVAGGVFVVGAAKTAEQKKLAAKMAGAANPTIRLTGTPKESPELAAVVDRMVTGRKGGDRKPKTGAAALTDRVSGLLEGGSNWSAGDVARELGVPRKDAATVLGVLSKRGELERVGRGVYKAARPSPEKRLPKSDAGGLTPRERAIVIEGKANGATERSGLEPTAVERVLAAIGRGPKKCSELLQLCSLTTQGCSEALASLSKAGKVTSHNGYWKLAEAA
jgi:hypothetical protein